MKTISSLVFVLSFFVFYTASAQTEKLLQKTNKPLTPHEFADDAYIPVYKEGRQTSPSYRYSSGNFTTVQVNVDENGNNILNDAANEPSIAMDPTNPNHMVIGWRQFDDISSNFRQAGYGYTTDGGQTWTFPGCIEPGVFRSDPVLGFDADGNIYYNSLTVQGDYWCDVYKSTDGGATWDAGTFAYGGDKQWFSIDRTSGPGRGNHYEYWSTASICEPYYFTRSINSAASFEDCISIQGEPYWGTVCVAGNGDLYVGGVYNNDFVVVKSSNAQYPGQMPLWDYAVPVDLDGSIVGFGGFNCPNPQGLLGQTIIAVDSSGGENHGNIYLLCSVERYSNNDPMDVMFIRSTDDGQTWSSALKINDDPGTSAWQWFGTMSVAPDGRIDVIWLDTRDNPGTVLSALYYSYSSDGGITWSENEKLSEVFDPHVGWPDQSKMGDYFDMFSDNRGAHIAWANTLNGEEDVYYGFISWPLTGITENHPQKELSLLPAKCYPNPFHETTTISYQLPDERMVSLKIYNLDGKEVATLVNDYQQAGSYEIEFNANNLTSSIYYYRLQAGTTIQTCKLTVIK